jgi:hypothetical protein
VKNSQKLLKRNGARHNRLTIAMWTVLISVSIVLIVVTLSLVARIEPNIASLVGP